MVGGNERVLRRGLEIFCRNSKTSKGRLSKHTEFTQGLALFYLQQYQYQAEYIVHVYSLSNFYNDVY